MLASITPLGERSRRQRWSVTVTSHVVGSAAGGVAAGAALGTVGWALARLTGAAGDERLVALAVVVSIGVALDAAGKLPTSRRQVNELWLHRYRGWVYGLGFGAQLGTGVATTIATSAVYAAGAAAVLSASPAWGAAIGAVFGAVRGAAPLTAGRIHSPPDLARFHARLGALDRPSRVATATVLLALAATASALAA